LFMIFIYFFYLCAVKKKKTLKEKKSFHVS